MVKTYVVNYHEHDSEVRYAEKKHALLKAISLIDNLEVGPELILDTNWQSKVCAELSENGIVEFFCGLRNRRSRCV